MINGDHLEFRVRERITERALKLREEFDKSLALEIVNRLAESLEKGSKS